MEIKTALANLHRKGDENAQLKAIDRLSAYAGDKFVFDALCTVALQTLNTNVRNRVIDLLKPQADRACRHFAKVAASAPSPIEHRWALVNLSLLKCHTNEAHTVVCDGFRNPDFEIQKASFLSTGLFVDPVFLNEVELFLERNRFFFIKDNVRTTASKMAAYLNRKRPRIRSRKTEGGHRLATKELR